MSAVGVDVQPPRPNELLPADAAPPAQLAPALAAPHRRPGRRHRHLPVPRRHRAGLRDPAAHRRRRRARPGGPAHRVRRVSATSPPGPFAATSRVRSVAAGAFVGAIIGRVPDRPGPARIGHRHPGGLPQCVAGPVRPADERQGHRRGPGSRSSSARSPAPSRASSSGCRASSASRSSGASGCWCFFGLFAGLLRTPMLDFPQIADLARFLFASEGLRPIGAAHRLLRARSASSCSSGRPSRSSGSTPCRPPSDGSSSAPLAVLVLALVLLFPLALGPFFAQVIALVALFVLLGLGLNITLGLAGLLDLGFVAFYAVGAYTVALLTSIGRVRDRRLELLAGHPVRGAVRDAVRRSSWACRSCASAATTSPSPRSASARSSGSWPGRTCSSRGSAGRAAS